MNRPKFDSSQFRKATRSTLPEKECVEIARGLGWAVVRDTKNVFAAPGDHQFSFTVEAFDVFQTAIRTADLRTALIPASAFDGCCAVIEHVATDVNVFRSAVTQEDLPAGAELIFTDGEVAAFFDGVHKQEFDVDSEITAEQGLAAAAQ
jgi:hypothetical protein